MIISKNSPNRESNTGLTDDHNNMLQSGTLPTELFENNFDVSILLSLLEN
jgi:hypothetical protein